MGRVVVGREEVMFVACGVVLRSGKAVDGMAERTVATGGSGVNAEGWLILMEQEGITMTKMSTQGTTD